VVAAKADSPDGRAALRTTAVPPWLETHTMRAALETATRGACSPETRASPATLLTRTGASNDAPPSRLEAA
jgi:hypothetical protein